MKVDEIIPTQCEIRDWNVFESMLEFVHNGGIFTPENLIGKHKGLIAIAKFEDGKFYFRDGHTRALAIFAAGYRELREGEFVIESFSYSQWEEINLEKGWVTPFDPRTELRVADFWNYKNAVPKENFEALRIICAARRKGIYSHTRNGISHIRDLFKKCSSCS